jgi:hypothetical protein
VTEWVFGALVALTGVMSVAALIDYAQGKKGPTLAAAALGAALVGGLLGWWFL